MDRLTQSILVALVGGALIAVTASGRFALYVKTGFGPLLWAAGIPLMIVGAASVVLALRADSRRRSPAPATGRDPVNVIADPADTGRADALTGTPVRADVSAGHLDLASRANRDGQRGHDHDRSKAAWLLVLPVLALLLAPPALGTDAVTRTAGSQAMADVPPPDPNGPDQIVTGDGGYKPNDGLGAAPSETTVDGKQVRTMDFPPLPAGRSPDVSLSEFVQRALYDPTGSVTAHPVTVTGFIAPAGKNFDDGYLIAQLIISCCAADARAIRVHVDGPEPFPEGTWVTAVVTAYPGSGTPANEYVPSVSVASITKRAQPADPYGR